MALLLFSSSSLTRAGVRAVSLREVIALATVACVVVGALAFVAGMSVGRRVAADELAQASPPDPLREGYAMQRLGEMSARLMALEHNASSLLRKLTGIEQLQGSLNKLEKAGVGPAVPRQSAPLAAPRDAAGGPQMAPVCDVGPADVLGTSSEAVARAEDSMACLQQILQQIEQSADRRDLGFMSLPNRAPISDVDLGSPFGNRLDPFTGAVAFHPGLDFAAPHGTPIHAAGGGRVRFSGFHNELGYVVEIDHGNGLISRYAHASQLFVKTGVLVVPGQRIAAVGSTGRSTGPHLHFEILRDGRYVDPMQYLNSGLRNDLVSKAR